MKTQNHVTWIRRNDSTSRHALCVLRAPPDQIAQGSYGRNVSSRVLCDYHYEVHPPGHEKRTHQPCRHEGKRHGTPPFEEETDILVTNYKVLL